MTSPAFFGTRAATATSMMSGQSDMMRMMSGRSGMLGVMMAEDATMQSMMSGEVKGEPMAALLREARARNVMPASVDTLLAAFPAPDSSAPHTRAR